MRIIGWTLLGLCALAGSVSAQPCAGRSGGLGVTRIVEIDGQRFATDSAGVIVAIRSMEPCTARLAAGCPTYVPGAEYRYALEVNRGFFARRGIRVGSRIVLADLVLR